MLTDVGNASHQVSHKSTKYQLNKLGISSQISVLWQWCYIFVNSDPDVPKEERACIQGELERVILRVLEENPGLHYYQGLHDVALTFLPVVGERLAFAIMNILVKCHIRYRVFNICFLSLGW